MTTSLHKRRTDSVPKEQKQTLAEVVANQLREEVISGQLAGGSMLAEIPTAERLGVSRVPVREATLVLERDGLVVFEGRGRCRVRALTTQDFYEIYGVRLMLEVEAFRLAAIHHIPKDLIALEANIQQMSKARSLARMTLLDIEFHDLIVQASRQSRIQHLWRTMRGQIQLFTAALQRELNQVTSAVRETATKSHHECLLTLKSRQEEKAMQAAREHLQPWEEWLQSTRRTENQS